MPRSGTGVYTLPSPQNPVYGGETILAADVNATNSDIADALTHSVATDGQSTITANIPMNNHKLTGLAAGTSPGDATVYEQLPTDAGFKNKIINGNFDIWQTGITQNSAGYGTADLWYVEMSGSSQTVTQQIFALGQTSVPNNPKYYKEHAVTLDSAAGSYAMTLQRIESVLTLSGKSAMLSFWAKASASLSMSIELVQNFGTGGSPSAIITGISVTKIALTTSWTKFSLPVTLPSISGKTLGTNNNDFLGVNFWFDAGSTFNTRTSSLGHQTGTFDISQVQLEEGTIATAFEQTPYQQILALCQRYLVKILPCRVFEWWLTATVGAHYIIPVAFPVQMRAAPTIFDATSPIVTSLNLVLPFNAASQNGFTIKWVTYTGVAQNGSVVYNAFDYYLADAQL